MKIIKHTDDIYFTEGIKELNKSCCIVLAGGQGTRLGSDKPKGMFIIDEKNRISLYEYLCYKIYSLQRDTNSKIMLYIMTNDLTYHDTLKFFENGNYFKLDKNQIKIFKQNTIICKGSNNEYLYIKDEVNNLKLATAPDGNGGLYNALISEGILDDMINKHIEYISIFSIDNFMTKVVDPILIGIHKCEKSDYISKVISRDINDDKMGLLHIGKDGKPCVIEYSEISKEDINKKDINGNLIYNNAFIGVHSFTINFLKRICNDGLYKLMPYHIAYKKIKAMVKDDNNSEILIEKEVDCIKKELFIFDIIKYADNFCAYQVDKSSNYMPLKNKDGKYGIEYCRQNFLNFIKKDTNYSTYIKK